MSKLNTSEMPISLAGQEFVLRASLRVAKDLNRLFVSLGNAIDQLRAANFDAAVTVIRIGANLQGREARDLEEKVYAEMGTSETAFGDMLVTLINFVGLVQRGGRPAERDVENEAQAEGNL